MCITNAEHYNKEAVVAYKVFRLVNGKLKSPFKNSYLDKKTSGYEFNGLPPFKVNDITVSNGPPFESFANLEDAKNMLRNPHIWDLVDYNLIIKKVVLLGYIKIGYHDNRDTRIFSSTKILVLDNF